MPDNPIPSIVIQSIRAQAVAEYRKALYERSINWIASRALSGEKPMFVRAVQEAAIACISYVFDYRPETVRKHVKEIAP